MKIEHLLTGLDTVECAYYLVCREKNNIDYAWLSFEKENIRQSKSREDKVIRLGNEDFLLKPYGTQTGYPFVIENEDFLISFGEFNNPSFFVKFKCLSLWQYGAKQLHDKFVEWTKSVGLIAHHAESLSRVDFSFDYQIPEIDFDENNFLSLSKKDSRYRKDRINQTFQFGKGDVVLRVYDKVAEIEEVSHKDWFYDLWQTNQSVWRIEWQIRKPVLKRFGLHTFDDLLEGQGDLLRYLVTEHDSLRIPNDDMNRSRWPLHPLWIDLQKHIETLNCLGVYRELDRNALLAQKEIRIAMSVYGYLKREAALNCVRRDIDTLTVHDTFELLKDNIKNIHDPFTWKSDVEKRKQQIRLGQ